MDNITNHKDFIQFTGKLISEQRFDDALNYLQKIIETDYQPGKALLRMEQIMKNLAYQNRDIFSSTNLDMDPWFE